jgi:hypothetical protein
MKQMKTAVKLLILILIAAGALWFVIDNWSWVFSKRVKGEIINVERVTEQTAILGSRVTDAQMHTYSILIQGEDGRMYTSASEDSQWQVAKKGFCVEALLYRYPPWRLSLAGNFFNARLVELSQCKVKTKVDVDTEVPTAPSDDSGS